MAYVPPHKRHSGNGEAPMPDSLKQKFNETLHIGTDRRRRDKVIWRNDKSVYAKDSVSKWFPAGSTCDDPIPASFRLEPFSRQNVSRQNGEEALVLVGVQPPSEGNKSADFIDKEPWLLITKKIVSDLLSTSKGLMDVVQSGNQTWKPNLVARFGKITFHGGSSSIDSIRKAALLDTDSRNQIRKSIHTNVPKAYMEDLKNLVIPKMGICFASVVRQRYLVKISDKTMPELVLLCKCRIADGGKLKICKVELNQVRHLVVDISCLNKDLDLRLMLCCKRVFTEMEDEEKDGIEKLIDAAIIDPKVKGGLRWPLGEESTGDRFRVIGSWHMKYTILKEPTMKIKLRAADRFDFSSSSGEVSNEVYLNLTELQAKLENDAVEPDHVEEVLERTTKLIWENFLDCKHQFA